MLTRSVILATTLALSLVAVVGSSALAVAFVPGDQPGATQNLPAIAAAAQDPAEGTTTSFLAGVPTTVALPTPIVIDGQADDDATEILPPAGIPTSAPTVPPAASESNPTSGNSGNGNSGNGNSGNGNGNSGNSGNGNSGNGNSGNGNSGNGNGNSGSGNSGQSKEDKAKKDREDKAKKDKEDAAESAE